MAHEDLRKYFPGDPWKEEPLPPVFIVTFTMTPPHVTPGPPRTMVVAVDPTRLRAELHARQARVDVCRLAYKDLSEKEIALRLDELFADLQEIQYATVDIHEAQTSPSILVLPDL